MTIGERIRSRREKLGIDRDDLAAAAGLTYSTIADLENGRSRSTTKLHLIAARLMTNTKWLETGRGDEDRLEGVGDERGEYVQWDAVLGYSQAVSLGSGAELQDYAHTHKLMFRAESLRRKGLFPDNLAVYYGDGDSMEPRIKDGDALLFDTSDTRPKDGAIFIVRWGKDYFAKRAEIIDGITYFRSDNPLGNHGWTKPKRLDNPRDPLEIVGRVRWIGSWEE